MSPSCGSVVGAKMTVNVSLCGSIPRSRMSLLSFGSSRRRVGDVSVSSMIDEPAMPPKTPRPGTSATDMELCPLPLRLTVTDAPKEQTSSEHTNAKANSGHSVLAEGKVSLRDRVFVYPLVLDPHGVRHNPNGKLEPLSTIAPTPRSAVISFFGKLFSRTWKYRYAENARLSTQKRKKGTNVVFVLGILCGFLGVRNETHRLTLYLPRPLFSFNLLFCGSSRSNNHKMQQMKKMITVDIPSPHASLRCTPIQWLPPQPPKHLRQFRPPPIEAPVEQLPREPQLQQQPVRPAPGPLIEPPPWAVPARGDVRLEPVCEAVGSHPSVDLTTRAFYRIGRSPASDVQLLHSTSSRRHAILFHHPNGSCYIVDCGSAHGTFVNGVRVRSTIINNGNASNGNSPGMVVPHRIRRGALIRFGGPGAPAFVLKSFAVRLDTMVQELRGVAHKLFDDRRVSEGDKENIWRESSISTQSTMISPDTGRCENQEDSDSSAKLVLLNTRLNALGVSRGARSLGPSGIVLAKRVQAHFVRSVSLSGRKRGLEESPEKDFSYVRDLKRMCTSSPSSSPIIVSPSPAQTVSPEATPMVPRKYISIMSPPQSLMIPHLVSMQSEESLDTKASESERKKVRFSDEPEFFYPPSVTPEDLSDDDSSIVGEATCRGHVCVVPPKTPRGVMTHKAF